MSIKTKQISLAQNKIMIGDAGGSASASPYTLPATDGSANQVLTTDGGEL